MRTKPFLFVMLFCLGMASTRAATITGTLVDVAGNPVQTAIVFDTMTVKSDPPNTVLPGRYRMTNDADGTFSVTLQRGNYTVSIPSSTVANFGARFNIYVPGGSGTHALSDLTPTAASVTGEANTVESVGDGETLYSSKAGEALRFKSLVAGDNVTIVSTDTNVTISAEAGGIGEGARATNLVAVAGSSRLAGAWIERALDDGTITNIFFAHPQTASLAVQNNDVLYFTGEFELTGGSTGAGSHTTNAAINFHGVTNVTFQGVGKAKLFHTEKVNGISVYQSPFFTMRNIELEGADDFDSTGTSRYHAGVNIQESDDLTFEQNYIHHWQHGIAYLLAGEKSTRNFVADQNKFFMIGVTNRTHQNTFDGAAIAIGGNGARITRNDFNTTLRDIELESNTGVYENIYIAGNVHENYLNAGIVRLSTGSVMRNVVIDDVFLNATNNVPGEGLNSAIFAQAVDNWDVRMRVKNVDGFGFRLVSSSGNSKNLKVAGQFQDVSTNAIHLEKSFSIQDVTVDNPQIHGVGGFGILAVGVDGLQVNGGQISSVTNHPAIRVEGADGVNTVLRSPVIKDSIAGISQGANIGEPVLALNPVFENNTDNFVNGLFQTIHVADADGRRWAWNWTDTTLAPYLMHDYSDSSSDPLDSTSLYVRRNGGAASAYPGLGSAVALDLGFRWSDATDFAAGRIASLAQGASWGSAMQFYTSTNNGTSGGDLKLAMQINADASVEVNGSVTATEYLGDSNIPRKDDAEVVFEGNVSGDGASFNSGAYGSLTVDVLNAGSIVGGGQGLPDSETPGEILRGDGSTYEAFGQGLFQGTGNTTNGTTTATFSTNAIPDNHLATYKFFAHVGEWTNNYATFEGLFSARNHSGAITTNAAAITEVDAADLYNLTMAVAGTNIVFGGSTTSTNDANWTFRITDTLLTSLGVAYESSETIQNDLGAFYTLAGNANDSSGNGLNLSAIGTPVYVDGNTKLHSYRVSGANQSGLTRPGTDATFQVRAGESFTLAAKITPQVAPESNRNLIGVFGGSALTSEFSVRISSDNTFAALMTTTSGTVTTRNAGPAVTAGQEYDVILEFDNSANTFTLYVDGVSQSQSFTSDGLFSGTEPFNMGSATFAEGVYIRNVGFWTRVLTADERTTWRGGWQP